MANLPASSLTRLEHLLTEQLRLHSELLSLLQRKRVALRQAAHALLTQIAHEENQRVQAIATLEKQRLMLVAELTQTLQPQAVQPMRMSELLDDVPEPMLGRLRVLRQQLIQRMQQVQAETQVTRLATQTVARHMQGMVQSITQAYSGGPAYTRLGLAQPKPLAISTLSLTA